MPESRGARVATATLQEAMALAYLVTGLSRYLGVIAPLHKRVRLPVPYDSSPYVLAEPHADAETGTTQE